MLKLPTSLRKSDDILSFVLWIRVHVLSVWKSLIPPYRESTRLCQQTLAWTEIAGRSECLALLLSIVLSFSPIYPAPTERCYSGTMSCGDRGRRFGGGCSIIISSRQQPPSLLYSSTQQSTTSTSLHKPTLYHHPQQHTPHNTAIMPRQFFVGGNFKM